MAAGPDPNRWTETDPQATNGGVGDPKTSRLGLSSTAITVIALLILAFVAAVLIF
ncbi:MAG TPA: hypothetical protein VF584_23665 [Longimicrobium sp.]|jgi:hypothetical protein